MLPGRLLRWPHLPGSLHTGAVHGGARVCGRPGQHGLGGLVGPGGAGQAGGRKAGQCPGRRDPRHATSRLVSKHGGVSCFLGHKSAGGSSLYDWDSPYREASTTESKEQTAPPAGPCQPCPTWDSRGLVWPGCSQGALRIPTGAFKKAAAGARSVETLSSAWLTSLDRHPCAAAPVDPPASTLGLWVKRFGLETCQFCLLLQSWNTGV